MKYLWVILRIIQAILWAVAMVMGIGNMPSGFGACFLLAAIFLTPPKVMSRVWGCWEVRAAFVFALVFYMERCLPMEDVDRAAENFCRLVERIREIFW